MLGLWHAANAAYGLDFKLLAHALAQLHEYFCAGTIPAGADGLLHEKEYRCAVVFGQVFRQIALVLAHPDADHTIVVRIAHGFQLALHSADRFRLAIGELD